MHVYFGTLVIIFYPEGIGIGIAEEFVQYQKFVELIMLSCCHYLEQSDNSE